MMFHYVWKHHKPGSHTNLSSNLSFSLPLLSPGWFRWVTLCLWAWFPSWLMRKLSPLSNEGHWDTNDLIYHRHSEQTCGCQGRGVLGEGLGLADADYYMSLFVVYTKLCLTLWDSMDWVDTSPACLLLGRQILYHWATWQTKLLYMYAKSLQSSQTLCDPMDCSLPGSYVQGIPQVRILEWVTMPSSRGSSWFRDWTASPELVGRFFTTSITWEAQIIIYRRDKQQGPTV